MTRQTAEDRYCKPEILALIQRFRDDLNQVSSWADFHLVGVTLARATQLYQVHYLSKGLTSVEIEKELSCEWEVYTLIKQDVAKELAKIVG